MDQLIVIGASSLRRTLDYLPYDLRVKYRRFSFAKSGLSLNPNNVSKLKKLQWLLRNDVINNSITKHPKNLIRVPVGHYWKFDLEERENTWFSNEVLFFKNSNGACHAQFSRDN